MKKLLFLFLLVAGEVQGGGLGVGLNHELIYIYVFFVVLMASIVAGDHLLKYLARKIKERHEKLHLHDHAGE